MTVDAVNDRALARAGDDYVAGHHWHLPDDETQQLRYTVRMLTEERDRLRRQEARCHALLDAVCGHGDEALTGRVAYLTKLVEFSGGCDHDK